MRWSVAPDANPVTADADENDIGESAGTITFAVGEVEAFVEISILEDDDIEPAREFLSVELLPIATDVMFDVKVATLAIQEGVCDRTPAVRDALRSERPCSAPTPATLARREDLDLRDRGVAALRSDDLLGLTGLRVLRLQENRLSELPAGLFKGIATLAELDLRNNPGTPFVLTRRLLRTDAEPWVPGPAEVALSVAHGAPFSMSTRLVAEGASLSAQTVSLLAGQIAAAPIRVFSVGTQAARLEIVAGTGAPTQTCRDERGDQQPSFRGLAVRAGPPLVLFKPRPRKVDAVFDELVIANGDRVWVPLSRLFVPHDARTYTAVSDNPALLRAWLAHGSVLVESADDADGTTTITVTATDAAGQSTSASFPVVSEFVPAASFLRHWRRAWLGGLQDTAD